MAAKAEGPQHPPFFEVVAGRHSCRAFLSTPVPAAELREVFELAQFTPSWCNSQPWQVELLSGDRLAGLVAKISGAAEEESWQMDIPGPNSYEGRYRERRRSSGFALYAALGIAREDRAQRKAQMRENFRFFGAPHAAIISCPRSLGTYGAIDCGGYISTLMFAARSKGIATVAQAAIAQLSPIVREELDISSDRMIVAAVALGYANESHPVNRFRTERAALDDVVTGLPA